MTCIPVFLFPSFSSFDTFTLSFLWEIGILQFELWTQKGSVTLGG